MSQNAATTAKRAAPGRPRDIQVDKAIMEATLKLLRSGGVVSLSVDDVARLAGCGKSAIYRRWASKEEMIVAALRKTYDPPEIPDQGSLRSDLNFYFDWFLDRYGSTKVEFLPTLASFAYFDGGFRDSLRELVHLYQESLKSVFIRAIQRGELPEELDLNVAVECLMAPVTYRKNFSADPLDKEYIERMLNRYVPLLKKFKHSDKLKY